MPEARIRDEFGTVTVAATVRQEGMLSAHGLNYHFTYTHFLEGQGRDTITNGLAWTSTFKLTATLELTLTASALLSRVSSITPDLTMVMPQGAVGGQAQYLSLSAGESMRYQPSPLWTYTESVGVGQLRYLGAADALPPTTFIGGVARAS